MKYERLFSPERIGKLTIKNRLVMTAMGCHLCNEDGTVSEELIAYYGARAKAGTGLIVTELTRVNEVHGVVAPHQISASKDEHIPGLSKLADAMHAFDCKIFLQLHHPGNTARSELNGRRPVVSASDIPSRSVRQQTRALTVDEIHSLVNEFGAAAHRCQLAGIDGVELHGAHFYLIHQFLSPTFNKRTDDYGGSFENRTRFLKEIVLAVRAACGPEYPLMVRISVEEYIWQEGYHLDEGIKICMLLDELGVDAIDVTAAGTASRGSQSVEPISYKQGWRRHLAAAVKKVVKVPVCTVCVIRDPAFAEELLEKGVTDFVGTGRSYLADPEWAAKAREGRESDIRKCISCVRCIDTVKEGKSIACSVNAECGCEKSILPLVRDGNGKRVVIVGAGPAGLEAARVCGERGFEVILFEKTQHVGGQIYLASNVPNKDKMKWFLDYELGQCKKLGVSVRTGKSPTIEEIRQLKPYAVIDATGASPIFPKSILGTENKLVCTPTEILSGALDIRGESVVIVGSGLTGLETAELLVEKNNAVTIMEMAGKIAPGASASIRNDILPRLDIHNVVLMPGRMLTKIESDRIYFKDLRNNEESMMPVDRVVLSLGVVSNNTFEGALQKEFERVYIIGDEAKCGRILEAVRDGYHAAKAL